MKRLMKFNLYTHILIALFTCFICFSCKDDEHYTPISLSYIGEDGEKHRPIMLHRAMLGSIERFMGILLESTGGNLPLWLSPEPVVVTPISEKFREYAVEIADRLRDAGVYARADLRDEKVNYKIRELSLAKTPIIAIVGEKEMENKSVTLRRLGVEKQETIPVDEFVAQMVDAVKMPA